MRCPTLSELPPPPPGKSGWPWTEETSATHKSSGGPHLRITIVTPSYNSIRYLEETIRSVLLQGYPDIEYIIMDGGSTDGATDIIKKYERWLTLWVSEKDKGYADAINKGFVRATGEIRAWLPASDTYLPSAFFAANRYLRDNRCDLVFGESEFVDEGGVFQGMSRTGTKNLSHLMIYGRGTPVQCATFWRKELHQKAGEFNSAYRYAGDRDWFLRLSVAGRCKWIPEITSRYRQHTGQLSSDLNEMLREGFQAWREVLKVNEISQFRVACGALLFVPGMRYRSGGLARMLRFPKISSFTNILFRR